MSTFEAVKPAVATFGQWHSAVRDYRWLQDNLPSDGACCPVDLLDWQLAEQVTEAEHKAVRRLSSSRCSCNRTDWCSCWQSPNGPCNGCRDADCPRHGRACHGPDFYVRGVCKHPIHY